MATQGNNAGGVGNNNKRKRGPGDQDAGRQVKAANTNGEHEAYTALLQGLDGLAGADDSTRTAQAALAAPMNQSNYPEPGTFDTSGGLPSGFEDNSDSNLPGIPAAQALLEARGGSQSGNKPNVGSAEWHQQRKDNHKEGESYSSTCLTWTFFEFHQFLPRRFHTNLHPSVERRRREVINEGIENIAKIVPGTEKNKGAILQRTCQYITELQNEKNSFVNERATFEIALKELTNRLDRMKESARTAWAESAKWQQRCRDAGLHFDDYDEGTLAGLEDDEVDTGVVS
jgi:bHLH factor